MENDDRGGTIDTKKNATWSADFTGAWLMLAVGVVFTGISVVFAILLPDDQIGIFKWFMLVPFFIVGVMLLCYAAYVCIGKYRMVRAYTRGSIINAKVVEFIPYRFNPVLGRVHYSFMDEHGRERHKKQGSIPSAIGKRWAEQKFVQVRTYKKYAVIVEK